MLTLLIISLLYYVTVSQTDNFVSTIEYIKGEIIRRYENTSLCQSECVYNSCDYSFDHCVSELDCGISENCGLKTNIDWSLRLPPNMLVPKSEALIFANLDLNLSYFNYEWVGIGLWSGIMGIWPGRTQRECGDYDVNYIRYQHSCWDVHACF